MNKKMYGNASRLVRRLLIFVWAAGLVGAIGAKADPVKTLVQDILYRADGSAAHGKVTIRWNGFSTAAGEAVAAGEMTVSTDANGGIAIPLVPNTGSTPSGTYYKVVVKLDDGTTSEEIWVVPATANTTVAAIRAKVVPQAVAAQFVSRDYVDSALSKVTTSGVVHLSGAESIQGVKTFLASPEVPLPTDAGGAANKAYVDQEVTSLANGTTDSFSSTVKAGTTVFLADGSWVINVKAFGAKCDGVTDDHTAIQAALDYAYANGGTLLFPVGTCLTSTLHYRGENMMGFGATVSYVRGKPGQDVFAQTDPAVDTSYQATRQFATINDLTVQVDSTVNAMASFPNRTLSPDGVRTWNVGNCGFAFPMQDGSHAAALFNHPRVSRVHVANYGGPNQSNGSCGFFLQTPDNDASYEDVMVQQTQFGYIQAPPVMNRTAYEWAPDANRYTHMSFYNMVPFVAFNGTHEHIAQMQMYSASVGAQSIYILGFQSLQRSAPSDWVIDDLYVEPSSSTTGMIGRITGNNHVMNSGNLKQAYGPAYIQWDASDSIANQVGMFNDGTNPVLKVSGNKNNIRILAHASTNVATDTGGGNRIEVSGMDAATSYRPFIANNARHPAYLVTSDSVLSGNVGSYYRNATDLLLFPNEITFNGGTQPPLTYDPTVALSGHYATLASPGGTFFAVVDGSSSLVVGQRVPKAKVRIYVYGQTGVAASQVWYLRDVTTSSNFTGSTLNFTTSWSVQYFDTDLSGASLGDVLQMSANSTSPNTTMSVAWIAIRPWADDVLVNGTVYANAVVTPSGGWIPQDTFAAGTPAEPFNSLGGLFLKPDTFVGGGVTGTTVVTDATVPISGKYRTMPSGGWFFTTANGGLITAGTTVPRTKVRTYVEGRAPGGAGSASCYLRDVTTSTNLAGNYINLGTGWTLTYWDTDLSATASGDTLQPTCSALSSSAAPDVAWVQFTPWPDAENVNGPVNATAYQVNGSALGFSNLGGTLGMAQIPSGGSSANFLRGDGTWANPTAVTFPKQVAAAAPATFSNTTGINSATLYTTVSAGLFRMCGFLDVTVAATAGTFTTEYGYTSDGHNFGSANILTGSVGPTQWKSTASPTTNANGNACTVFYADAATPVTWLVAASGVTGTPTVRYGVTLEQLE